MMREFVRSVPLDALRKYSRSDKNLFDATALQHDTDGLLLERWFLKHAVNLFVVSRSTKRWLGGSAPSNPPKQIVEAAFGLVNPSYG
jgi:hypothetical protein